MLRYDLILDQRTSGNVRLAQYDSVPDHDAVSDGTVPLDVGIGTDAAIPTYDRAALDAEWSDQLGIGPHSRRSELRLVITADQVVAIDGQKVRRAGQC